MAIIEHEVQVRKEAPAKPLYPELLRAAEVIRKKGWVQFAPELNGAVCATTAMLQGHSGRIRWVDLVDVVTRSLGVRDKCRGIENWNDAEGRTKEEVIEALERAAWGI